MPTPLRITPLGHSCVLLEASMGADTVKVLLDPGSLTPELTPISGLDAILITHAHADHIDPSQVRRLRQGGRVPVYADAETVAMLVDAGEPDVRIVEAGTLAIGGMTVEVTLSAHEEIYPGLPLPSNHCYHVSKSVFAPGDSFAVPDFKVDTLLVPLGAPWLKLSQTIDYLRSVAPRIAIPVHGGGLAADHRKMHLALLCKFAPAGTTVIESEIGRTIKV
ncbi:MBL fold metallo-hydrolase [Microbacterium sp. 1P10UB]|uniref:MBL fold metallo-hydrolase n=1 Tax=unclassified Microbacterium TaxID=2609290 RepID=UPI0039A22F7C